MTLINAAWSFFGVSANIGGVVLLTEKYFLGLQGIYIISGPTNEASGIFQAWVGANGNGQFETQCNSAGEVAFALVLTAVILSAVVAITTVNRFFANTPFSKFLAVSGAFFATAASVTAFSNWHVQCFLAFRDNYFVGASSASITNYEYYGFNVAVVGWVFSLVTFVLHIAAPTGSSAGPSTPDAPNQKF